MTLFCAVLLAVATGGSTIQGTVRAEGELEPIAGATVLVKGTGRAVLTDRFGYFVLTDLPAGSWTIEARALGYRENHLSIVAGPGGTLRLDFELEREPVRIAPVEAKARTSADEDVAVPSAGPAALHLSGGAMKRFPGLAEPDVFRALQTLPAIAAASDYSSALYVRGGTPDQTLVTLDGVPLFNPYHLGGVFAAIDPDVVASAEAYPGAVPATLADRLSGAVDVRTRDGGRDHARFQGGVGLLSSRVTADGPLPGGHGSYLFSARRTYVDLFTDAAYLVHATSFTVPYNFGDAHLKLTRDVGALGRLSASVYVDRERVSLPERMRRESGSDMRYNWGSRAASVALRTPLGARVLSEFRVAFTDFTGRFEQSDRKCTSVFASACAANTVFEPVLRAGTVQQDLLASAEFTAYGRNHVLHLGVNADSYLFSHQSAATSGSISDYVPTFQRSDRPVTVAAHLEDEWSPTTALALRLGARALYADGHGTTLLPRVGARLDLSRQWSLSLGGGRYAQVMHSLRDEEAYAASFVAYDLLGGVQSGTPLLTGEDVVLGAAWHPHERASLRVDAYAKRMSNVPLPVPPDDPAHATIVTGDPLGRGAGRARGLEVYGRFGLGASDVTVGYALASVQREIGGDMYAARFDRRHVLDLSSTTPLGRAGELSARLSLASGQPYTPVAGVSEAVLYDPATGGMNTNVRRIVLLGPYNSARLPGYVRLDLAARKNIERTWFGRRMTLTPYVQVLNALNNKNVLLASPSGSGVPRLEYVPQLPILPTFGVEWRF